MPFANDNPNIATIKQVRSNSNGHSNNLSLVGTPVRECAPPMPPLSSVMSAPPSVATSPTHYWPRSKLVPYTGVRGNHQHNQLPNSNGTNHHEVEVHAPPPKQHNGDVIEDIETMLANLSNQLDAMLDKKD